MSDEQPSDRGTLEERFPWIGLARVDDSDLSSRYREIMAESRRDREAIEAQQRPRTRDGEPPFAAALFLLERMGNIVVGLKAEILNLSSR